MKLVVTDANIVIDLVAGGLLEEMFRLPGWEFCVPDVLYEEELADHHGLLLTGLGLKIETLPADAVEYVAGLRQRYRGPSTNDLFALALARSRGGVLLSGDGPLRKAAEAEGVEIHGTLWLGELLFEAGLVTAKRMTDAYEAMRGDGSRLPWDRIRDQLRRWQTP